VRGAVGVEDESGEVVVAVDHSGGEPQSVRAQRPVVRRGHLGPRARGSDDGVAPDETVAYEYAKVRRLYAKLGIPDRTEIEFFKGPHAIHGKGTFDFLHKHLNWPMPAGE